MADLGMLVYDRYDSRGANVERIEKFYPIPPISECNMTSWGSIRNSLSAMS